MNIDFFFIIFIISPFSIAFIKIKMKRDLSSFIVNFEVSLKFKKKRKKDLIVIFNILKDSFIFVAFNISFQIFIFLFKRFKFKASFKTTFKIKIILIKRFELKRAIENNNVSLYANDIYLYLKMYKEL